MVSTLAVVIRAGLNSVFAPTSVTTTPVHVLVRSVCWPPSCYLSHCCFGSPPSLLPSRLHTLGVPSDCPVFRVQKQPWSWLPS